MQPVNNPSLAGQKAGRVEFFGPYSRYAVYPVHTRFDAVQWFVVDAEHPESKMGDCVVIRQAATRKEAMKGLT